MEREVCVPWVSDTQVKETGRKLAFLQGVPQLLQHKCEGVGGKQERKDHKFLNMSLPFFGACFEMVECRERSCECRVPVGWGVTSWHCGAVQDRSW